LFDAVQLFGLGEEFALQKINELKEVNPYED
jgi:hypothetical protein